MARETPPPDLAAKRIPGAIAPSASRGGYGPRAAARTIYGLLARCGQRQGLRDAALLVDWASIMGAELAACCVPERLAPGRDGGILHIRVASAWALDVQHRAPLIVERINTYLGRRAVARLAIRQGPMPRPRPGVSARRRLADGERAAIDHRVAMVEDEELRAALASLARAVAASAPAQRLADGDPNP